MGGRGIASGMVSSPANEAFGLLTDIDRLPAWNKIIVKVVEHPETLNPGTEWVVQLKAMGSSWQSRSTIEEHDPGRFSLPTAPARMTGTRRTRAGAGQSNRPPATSHASR